MRDTGPCEPRKIVLLGSTGSIGTQAIDVVDGAPHLFEVVALSAGGGNLGLPARQAVHTRAQAVGVASGDPGALQALIDDAARAAGVTGYRPEIVTGPDASTRIAGIEADVVLNGITGSIGLAPTLAALKSGATLALANKESLIVGGALVKAAAREGQIVPVDSEHSAIAQCLRSGTTAEVDRLILTASGGPFRGKTREELHEVSPQDALAHPTWDMGLMVTTNSASLVNKGLEVIEATCSSTSRWTGSTSWSTRSPWSTRWSSSSTVPRSPRPPRPTCACRSRWAWAGRTASPARPARCDWHQATSWTFEPLDTGAFPAVGLAKDAAKQGSTYPAVFNAANEEAVMAFHAGRIRFTDIVDTIEAVLSEHTGSSGLTVESVLDAERWARARTHERLAVRSV